MRPTCLRYLGLHVGRFNNDCRMIDINTYRMNPHGNYSHNVPIALFSIGINYRLFRSGLTAAQLVAFLSCLLFNCYFVTLC